MNDARPILRIPAPPRARVALGLTVVALAIFATVVVVREPGDWPFAGVLVIVAALVILRGLPAGVELREKELVVRDYLFTTRILRDRIVAVERFPAIDWVGSDGVPRVTLVNVFLRRAAMITAPTDEERDAARVAIEFWLARGDGRPVR